MQIGLVGLGRMGFNMGKRWLRGNHEVIAYNRTADKVKLLEGEGARGAYSLAELVEKLNPPRVVWIMLPAGTATEEHVAAFSKLLSRGDILIDGGNAYYKDDIRRSALVAERGVRYLDAGVSGGIWGLANGYCTMIGGEREAFAKIEPLLATLAPKDGYLYCGPSGSGHFVKMVHNGIEYAMMQSYGEGFEILNSSQYSSDLNFHDIAKLWNRGSVVRSWLLELLESAFEKDPTLSGIKGVVEDSGEGRWTVQQAIDTGVPATVIAHSLFERFRSRDTDSFSDRILAALRHEFGGHAVKGAEGGERK